MFQKLLTALAALSLLVGSVGGLQNTVTPDSSGNTVETSEPSNTSEASENESTDTSTTSSSTTETSSSEEEPPQPINPIPGPDAPLTPDVLDGLEPDGPSVSVSSWKELNTALTDTTVTNILVTKDITADNSDGAKINHKVTVNFDQHLLNIGDKFFALQANGDLQVQNIILQGTTGNFVQSATDSLTNVKLTLSGTFDTATGNTKNIAKLLNGTVEFNGLSMTYEHNNGTEAAVRAKNFTITNHSNIVSNSIQFFYSTVAGVQVLIDGQSYVETNSNKGNNTYGQAWEFDGKVDIWIKGNSKLKATGDIYAEGVDGGVFIVSGAKSTLNVLENSSIDIYSKQSPALIIQSSGGSFNVDDHSLIKLRSDGEHNSIGATLRFREVGNMTFNITNQSTIDVEKTAGVAAAVRLYSNNNAINVSGGSDFTVHNRGGGTPIDPGLDLGGKQGVQFVAGTVGNQFNVKDAGSDVKIIADNGAAIDGVGNALAITAGKDTYFTARGKTATTAGGIFNSSTLNFNMTGVRYFDFRNDRSGGGNIMTGGSNSTFTSTGSDVSFWDKGRNLDGDPLYTWYNLNYSLKGTNLTTLVSTDNTDMQDKFKTMKLTNFSRMSANNATAVINDLRVPTNADKFIYTHAAIPESEGELRDANTGEVKVDIGLYDPAGNLVKTLSGESIGTPTSVYGETPRRGLIKIEAPDQSFLKTGYRLKVLEAWRGATANGWVHPSGPEDLTTDNPPVYDVTPPAPTVLEGNLTTISPLTKSISGKGEAGAKVLLALNGATVSQTTTVAADGSYQLPLPDGLKKDDVLSIMLQDQAGPALVIAPPTTNSTIGNIQPLTDMSYHDAIFPKAKSVTVTGILELAEVPRELDFGQRKVTNKTQDYQPSVTGKLIVSDTRGDPKSPWQLKLKEASPLTGGSHDLSGLLSYQNQQGEVAIGPDAAIVESGQMTADGVVTISDTWQNKRGLHLRVPVGKQIVSDYHGKLAWSLENVPANQ